MNKVKQISNIVVFGVLILALTAFLWLGKDKEASLSERRPLRQFDQILNVEERNSDDDKELPFEEFVEKYLLDQFPMRDEFRQIKAFLYMDVLHKNDNNDIYKYNDTVIKIEDNLSQENVSYSTKLFENIIKAYFSKNENVYYSIIPDKHYYASKENGYPSMDYEKLIAMMNDGMTDAEYIDITDKLTLSDYYKTDSHWSQEKIDDVAQFMLDSMNNGTTIKPENGWKVVTMSPFYGVYYGQSALSIPPEDIKYLTSEEIDGMTMTVMNVVGKTFSLEKYQSPYIKEMFNNNDPYDVFMGGAKPIIVIDNPKAKTDKELVVFRDSFGSSMSPLLACGYKKVYVLDIRYCPSHAILSLNQLSNGVVPKDFVEFNENQDVLFMYSTGMINASIGAIS